MDNIELSLNIHWKDWCWSWSYNTLATWYKSRIIGKDPNAGDDWRQEEKGMTEDEMVGWNHWFNGQEFEQTLGDREGQESLVCCSPRGHEEPDTTERLSNNNLIHIYYIMHIIYISPSVSDPLPEPWLLHTWTLLILYVPILRVTSPMTMFSKSYTTCQANIWCTIFLKINLPQSLSDKRFNSVFRFVIWGSFLLNGGVSFKDILLMHLESLIYLLCHWLKDIRIM